MFLILCVVCLLDVVPPLPPVLSPFRYRLLDRYFFSCCFVKSVRLWSQLKMQCIDLYTWYGDRKSRTRLKCKSWDDFAFMCRSFSKEHDVTREMVVYAIDVNGVSALGEDFFIGMNIVRVLFNNCMYDGTKIGRMLSSMGGLKCLRFVHAPVTDMHMALRDLEGLHQLEMFTTTAGAKLDPTFFSTLPTSLRCLTLSGWRFRSLADFGVLMRQLKKCRELKKLDLSKTDLSGCYGILAKAMDELTVEDLVLYGTKSCGGEKAFVLSVIRNRRIRRLCLDVPRFPMGALRKLLCESATLQELELSWVGDSYFYYLTRSEEVECLLQGVRQALCLRKLGMSGVWFQGKAYTRLLECLTHHPTLISYDMDMWQDYEIRCATEGWKYATRRYLVVLLVPRFVLRHAGTKIRMLPVNLIRMVGTMLGDHVK